MGMIEEYKEMLYKQNQQNYEYQCERMSPHVIHNAQIIKDGNQQCYILGDLPTGVYGFGDTPKLSCEEFDRVWNSGIN